MDITSRDPFAFLPADRASFAVASRLIVCLVSESILDAVYVPIHSAHAAGVCIVLSTNTMGDESLHRTAYDSEDIHAIVPLHHAPILREGAATKHGRLIGLIDVLDMLPFMFEPRPSEECDVQPAVKGEIQQAILSSLTAPLWQLEGHRLLADIMDPVYLWNKFSETILMDNELRASLAEELRNSRAWQDEVCRNPPVCPSLDSPAVLWEQSLFEGHPTHPMHRARHTLPPIRPILPGEYDFYHPRIRLVAVPRTELTIKGDFEVIFSPVVDAAFANAGSAAPQDTRVFIPVHEIQIPNIVEKFPGAEIFPPEVSVDADGQANIRTIVVPSLQGYTVKLTVGMKISAALRTVSHYTADFGPRFTEAIVPKLSVDPKVLVIEREVASAVASGVDPEVAKHLAAVVRERYDAPDERVIICAALVEMGLEGVPSGVPTVQHVFKLDTDQKRYDFLDRYVRLIFEGLLRPVLVNGVAFEAHGQNMLARFDAETGVLVGFVVRGLTGIRVHASTLRASTGVDFRFLPGHVVAAPTLEETYEKLYHTLVHSHLQRLIRALRLHHDGRGWTIVRRHLEEIIPLGHPLRHAWLERTAVDGKCYLRMKMLGKELAFVYKPWPNLIHYRPLLDE